MAETSSSKFFVYMIESPSAVDIYHQRSEGALIQQATRLNQMECVMRTAINLEAFGAALGVGIHEAMKERPGDLPLIHISAHGNEHGIQLSSSDILPWSVLKDYLRPINKALQQNLIVCMSSCEGFAGVKMAMHPEDEDLPYFALVGCLGKPTWAEAAVAYATFYHQIWIGSHVEVAIEAMGVASGIKEFCYSHASQSRQIYIDAQREKLAVQAEQELGQQAGEDSEFKRKEE